MQFTTRILLLLTIAFLVIAAEDASSNPARVQELPKLCSGPPADPLWPVRTNKPSAAEMAAKPRQHPYLFFDGASRQALRDRATSEPFRNLAARLRTHAEDCLKRPIPPLAKYVEGLRSHLPNGSYNPEYLRNNYDDFYHQSYLLMEVIPTLAFAYQLTGERCFGDKGKEWLLNFAARPKLAKKEREADFDAANIVFALTLGYDWLWELLTEPERQLVRQTLARMALPIVAAAKNYLAQPQPEQSRGWLGNNHTTRTHGLFGLTPLALLYELPEAADWLDVEIQLNRDRLYPSAWAPNGEHLDAWDHFDTSFGDPIPFLVALKRLGGEDLFNDPRLAPRFRGIPRFWLYGLEMRTHGPASNYAWLALASHLKDPVAQWIAARDGKLSEVNEIFGYLFYDPSVPAAPPADPRGSVYWPYSGMAKMCSGWTAQTILIPFRCGPEIGKDLGDQNGFTLRAGGEWLAPRLSEAQRKPGQPVEFDWDLWAWFRGSPAQNVVVLEPDGIGDFATYEKTGKIPLKGGIQFAQYPPMKGRQYAHQWLSGPDVTKNGDLRVVHFDAALDYVCGEAHRAYAYNRPALWVRHVMFVKAQKDGPPPYVLICDELEAGKQPMTFAWQLHAGHAFAIRKNGLTIQGHRAELDVHLLTPADGKLVQKQTPAPLEQERTRFIQWRTPGPQSRCVYLTALVPRTKKDTRQSPTFRVIEAAGGWAMEARTNAATDVALFRSERAQSVTAGDISTTGTAGLFRKRGDSAATFYVLGKR